VLSQSVPHHGRVGLAGRRPLPAQSSGTDRGGHEEDELRREDRTPDGGASDCRSSGDRNPGGAGDARQCQSRRVQQLVGLHGRQHVLGRLQGRLRRDVVPRRREVRTNPDGRLLELDMGAGRCCPIGNHRRLPLVLPGRSRRLGRVVRRALPLEAELARPTMSRRIIVTMAILSATLMTAPTTALAGSPAQNLASCGTGARA
jgi:hypothetical protein